MRVRHPYSLTDDGPSPDGAVHWGGRRRMSEVDADGTFVVPDDADHNLDAWADGYGYDLADLVVEDGESAASRVLSNETDTCTVVLTNGGTCGRERPCQYHDD